MTERTHRAAHAAPSGRVAGVSLRGLQGGGVEGGREEGKNRDRRRVEQGRTRQRPRSQPLSHEYYRSLFLFGIRGRYVSPGVCVGCCLGEDTKLAAPPLAQKLFSDQVGGGHRGGAAGTPWRLGRSCHPTQLASQSSRRKSVHKHSKTAPRGRFRRSVYTPDCLHVRSRDRAASRVPRRRRPHGPHEARAART